MDEQWKDIPNYEGFYQISNNGKVRSLDRYVKRKGHGVVFLNGGIRPSNKNKNGYLQIGLSKNGETKRFYIHRLVAQLFLENPLNLNEVNHLDHNKENNCVENLEWTTHKDNLIYTCKNGKMDNFKRPVYMLKMYSDEIIMEYPSIRQAVRELKLPLKSATINITSCCRGKCKSSYGYSWKYSKTREEIHEGRKMNDISCNN